MVCTMITDKDIFIKCEKCDMSFNVDKNLLVKEDATTCTIKNPVTCIRCKNISSTFFAKSESAQKIWKIHHNIPLETIPVCCPKCGSIQIQAVPRKWSLLTGILTNKTDRVCLNCMHKF